MFANLDPMLEIPEPLAIHRRLGEIERERRILDQLLKLSLKAKDEAAKRQTNLRECGATIPQVSQ